MPGFAVVPYRGQAVVYAACKPRTAECAPINRLGSRGSDPAPSRRPVRGVGQRGLRLRLPDDTAILRSPMPRLLISCGEASGDLYGAELVRHLRERVPGLDVARPRRRPAPGPGRLAVRARPRPRGRGPARGRLPPPPPARRLPARARRSRPPARRTSRCSSTIPTSTCGWPGSSIAAGSRSSTTCRRRSGPGGAGACATIRETVARMLVIFPSRRPLYREAGVPVTFVGHPLVSLVPPGGGSARLRRELGLDAGTAGRRPAARKPPQGGRAQPAAHRGLGRCAGRRASRSCSSWPRWRRRSTRPWCAAGSGDRAVTIVHDRTHAALSAATAAIVASGTATVEAALLGAPMVVVYRLSPWTYRLGRRFVRVPYYAMVNLIARPARRSGADPIRLHRRSGSSAELLPLLDDTAARRAMQAGLREVREKLGGPGASGRAADVVAPYPGIEKALTDIAFHAIVSGTF